MSLQMPGKIILVLGDQLSPYISSLQTANKNKDIILMAEVADEANYVPHHKKKDRIFILGNAPFCW
jgi:deoxyribodipyrimidine photolyase-related protein